MAVLLEQMFSEIQEQGMHTAKDVVVTGTVCTLPSTTTIGGSSVSALGIVTSASANALTAGPNGATNPSFNVDASAGSAATGLNVAANAAASGLALSVLSSGTDESLTVDAKGAGAVKIGGVSTGIVKLGHGSRKTTILAPTLAVLNAQSVTPTAAQLLGGIIKHTTQTGGGTFTLDTGTNISAAISGVAVGDSFTCILVNNGNQTSTITTAASGTTLFGTAAVATGLVANMVFYCTGSNTWDVYINVSA